VRVGLLSARIAYEPNGRTMSTSRPFFETLRCTASVGISTYPGRHCSNTSLTTLSNASVQLVSVGLMLLRMAWEQESGLDILLKVLKVLGVLSVWCNREFLACRPVDGAPTMCRTGRRSAREPATPLGVSSHPLT